MNHPHTQRHDESRETERDEASKDGVRHPRIDRRKVLVAGSAIGTGFLAGCFGRESEEGGPPDPVTLSENEDCDVCGMVISEHPGPNGEIFYRENSPENHDNPARFDSPKACLFPYYFEHEQRDWTAEAVYVTDYSKVDYEISVIEEQKYIETATSAETFSDAENVVFVVGSEVHGAMGPDFIPFSDEDDGASFIEQYGGQTVTMDEITPEMLGR